MRRFLPISAVLAAALASLVAGYTITVEPSTTECFYEDLKQGDTLTISFEVGEAGNGANAQEIDFHMTDAYGRVIQSGIKVDTGFYTATADRDGKWTFCFNNHMSMVTNKVVSFYVHEQHRPDKEEAAKEAEKKGSAVDPLEKEIQDLGLLVQTVRDHQQYIMYREHAHRATAESTNDRVKWWGVFQVVLLIFVAFFQITYLKRFFEVKRVV